MAAEGVLDKPMREEINALHASLCSGLADPNRIAMLYALSAGSQNVTDLVRALEMPQSSVSRHLRVLRDRQLVTSERRGTMVYYELADSRVIDALDILRAVLRDRLESRGQLADAL
ncbi:MAG: ArsR/SmtB family transcription factor [Anaerolineae bacterium]|jgi:ArsR family transcriptional regulator